MTDPVLPLTLAATGLAGIGLTAAAALRGWREWLDVRRLEIDPGSNRRTKSRSELAELRERVRRLETIANGGEG